MKMHKFLALAGMACLFASISTAHPGSGIATDSKGNVYFIDTGSGVWKIDTGGKLAHLAGPRYHWMAIDEENRFARTRLPQGADGDIVRIGSNPTVLVSSDYPIAIGHDKNFYYPARGSGTVQIMRVVASGSSSVFATLPRSVSGRAIEWINGITTGPNGSYYYTEDTAIRRIDANGRVTTAARDFDRKNAPSIPGIASSDGAYLRGLAVNAEGVMYVAASGTGRVIKVGTNGAKTTLAQTASPWSPTAVAVFGPNVYAIEFTHDEGDDRVLWLPRVRKIASDGTSTIIATLDNMPGARPGKN